MASSMVDSVYSSNRHCKYCNLGQKVAIFICSFFLPWLSTCITFWISIHPSIHCLPIYLCLFLFAVLFRCHSLTIRYNSVFFCMFTEVCNHHNIYFFFIAFFLNFWIPCAIWFERAWNLTITIHCAYTIFNFVNCQYFWSAFFLK